MSIGIGIGNHCAIALHQAGYQVIATQKMLLLYKRKGYIAYSFISPLASQFNRD